MNPYSLAAVVIITLGIVATVLILCKYGWKFGEKGLDKAGEIAGQPAKIVETVTGEAGKTVRALGEPVSKGIAEICHEAAQLISQRQKNLEELQSKITSLTYECDQLRKRQIKVDQIQPIFQIAFFKASFSELNFVKEIINISPASSFERKEEIEYLGIFRATNKQKLGVNLENLRFRISSPFVIEVSGLGKTELVGNSETTVDPEHVELRRHLTGGTVKADVHEIIKGDPDDRRAKRERKQSSDLLAAITQQKAVEEIDQAIEKMALQYLKDYFLPRGYNIVRAIDETAAGKTIYQIRDEINGELDVNINNASRLLSDAEQKKIEVVQELEKEIQKISRV